MLNNYPMDMNQMWNAYGTIGTICLIVFYVLVAAGSWKMFTKAGEAGWKALIPFYSDYIRFKIAWKTDYYWVLLCLSIVGAVIAAFASNMMMVYIYVAISIVCAIIQAVLQYNIALAYGKGLGYFIGLLFFPYIFTMILGFGGSRYVGNRYAQA